MQNGKREKTYKRTSWKVNDPYAQNYISGYFTSHDYDKEPSQLYVIKQRKLNNEDKTDKELLKKLESEAKLNSYPQYQAWLNFQNQKKEDDGWNQNQ